MQSAGLYVELCTQFNLFAHNIEQLDVFGLFV